MRYWGRFARQIQQDLKLWLLFMLCLGLFRLAFIAVFRDQLVVQSILPDLLAALWTGARFDSMATTYILLPLIVMSFLCGCWDLERWTERARQTLALVYLVVTPLLGCVAIEYHREFGDIFNQFLFNAYYDNKTALLSTVYEQYNLVPYLCLVAAAGGTGFWVQRRFFRGPFLTEAMVERYTRGNAARLAVTAAIVLAIVVGLRGSAGRKPVNKGDMAVSIDPLINKATVNPYMALVYATKVQLAMAGEAGLKELLPDEDLGQAMERAFGGPLDSDNLDQYLVKTAQGPRNVPPKHIFVLGMESYDAWTLLDKYRSLGFSENLRRIAGKGLHIEAFLPADDYSIRFGNVVITGMPDAGILTNWQRSAEKPYPTSLPETLRKLGYRTRYFCGAPLSWQNVEHFCKQQGFDEVYGSTDIMQATAPDAQVNLWAAPDKLVWQFIAGKIKDDEPSFTFVQTSSYHVPYDVDLEAEGCPLKEVPAELREAFTQDDQNHLHKLGHLWYADKYMGKFVDEMERRVERPLFVITGDHYGRNFINAHPTLFEKSAVPLVLYGKEVLKNIELPEGVAGGHIDIAPTILELTAPAGFQYHSFGQNLLQPQKRFFGYGSGRIIGHNYILEVKNASVLHPIPGRALPAGVPEVDELVEVYRAVRGISWWRVKRGSQVPVAAQLAKSIGKPSKPTTPKGMAAPRRIDSRVVPAGYTE